MMHTRSASRCSCLRGLSVWQPLQMIWMLVPFLVLGESTCSMLWTRVLWKSARRPIAGQLRCPAGQSGCTVLAALESAAPDGAGDSYTKI